MIALIEAMLGGVAPRVVADPVSRAALKLLAPITRPRKNGLCIGNNSAAHAHEFAHSGYDSSARSAADAVPAAPIVFTKAPTALNGPHDDVGVPWNLTRQVDYAGEPGVVSGRPGRFISRDRAYEHVLAYCVLNDLKARDLPAKHKQWLRGKSIDDFCPLDPWSTTAAAITPHALTLECFVNGERRQHASTADLIVDIPTIIATLSAAMTLACGDLIATGTPAGVGVGFDPPKFLHAGDRVRVAIAGLGEIENRIV